MRGAPGARVFAIEQVTRALGGSAGSRLAEQLGIPASDSTLLRQLGRKAVGDAVSPGVLGIEDRVWGKGRRQGTILCDLERGKAIGLLADHSAETLDCRACAALRCSQNATVPAARPDQGACSDRGRPAACESDRRRCASRRWRPHTHRPSHRRAARSTQRPCAQPCRPDAGPLCNEPELRSNQLLSADSLPQAIPRRHRSRPALDRTASPPGAQKTRQTNNTVSR